MRSPALLILLLALGACAHKPQAPAPAGGRLAELHILTAPVGLNVDGKPGADGFSLKVYANNARDPKTVPITEGTLEVLMFDGTFYGKTNRMIPRQTWTFTAPELKTHQIDSSIGAGYDFLLLWGTNHPTERIITVLARLHADNGDLLVSDRASVTVLEK